MRDPLTTAPDIRIRPAMSADLPFIERLVPRLTEFGPPPWRDAGAIASSSARMLAEALQSTAYAGTILIAETAGGDLLGFVQVEIEGEFFTGEPQAYIPNLAVAMNAEGRGAGRVLMAAAEDWARAQGLRHLTLFVFAANHGARSFYERLGFVEDSLKLVKPLG